jgi:RNA polymerase sigma factor (sigma-70 family)
VSMSQADGEQPAVEPLTRRNADGEVYRREPSVECQIVQALRLAPCALVGRARLADAAAPGFLKEEAVVYLLRRAHRRGEGRTACDLTGVLLQRCTSVIQRRLGSLGPEALEDAYGDVVAELFGRILDLDSDRGDFAQVRFWVLVERLAIRAFDTQVWEADRARRTVSLEELADWDRDDDDPGHTAQANTSARCDPSLLETVVIQYELMRDALDHIEEPYRTAFLLRYVAGWPIEDRDPTVRTISRHFRKDPRTIRTWLSRAKEALRDWKDTQP